MTLLGSSIGMMMMMMMIVMNSRHSSAFAVCHEGWATVGALGDNWGAVFEKGPFSVDGLKTSKMDSALKLNMYEHH